MSLLSVKNLSIRTSTTPLVHNVSFTVEPGETVALVGESGSGKTLTALSILGLLAPELAVTAEAMTFTGPENKSDGPVELKDLKPAALRAIRGRVISMIFQEPATALNPVLTCGYQVAEAFFIHTSLSRAEAKKRVLALFERVHLPDVERIFRSYPHQLSGGQRQRVMIAMALAHQPKLLIADEPTTALDVTVQAEIIKLVKELQADLGMAMLWITHDFGVVRELANRVVVMQQGRVVESGPAAQVLNQPTHAYTRQLLGATVSLNLQPVPPAKNAKPILVAENLNLSYGTDPLLKVWPFDSGIRKMPALKNVGFSLNAGETLGVVGESGSGKSTLARVLTRLLPAEPDAQGQGGSILLLGENFLALRGTQLRQKRRHLQMVFQDPSAALNPRLRVGDAIAEGVAVHRLRPKAAIRPYVEKLLSDVGLPANAYTRYPHQFSGGQKQRLCIARALALQPKVIIADEAVSALDVSVQAQILTLLKKLQAEHGTSFIFISHDLRVVSQLAQNVLVMHRGAVVESGPTSQVFAKPQHPYTQHLLAAVLETDPLTGPLGAAPVPKSAKSKR